MTLPRETARIVLACGAGAALALVSSAADGPSKIHECKDAKGNVVYQDDPCLEPPPAAVQPKAVVRSKTTGLKPVRKPEAALPGQFVDARWATPEKALRTFVDAVKAGDRALVLSCLTSSALAELGPDVASLPLEELRATVDSFTAYVSEGDLGPYWSIRALRAGMRPKWILFERVGGGAWKIGAI